MKKITLLLLLQLTFFTGFSQSFKIGDKIEAYNSGAWYKGSIIEIGSGNYTGYYEIKYVGYSQVQWIKASNIKLQKATNENADAANGPRNGEYIILSYGSPTNPIRIGYFKLNNGSYTYYSASGRFLGKGTYDYIPKSQSVVWTSGPFKNAKWSGKFEISREGMTHKIRLNYVTIGTNSSDSK